MLTMLFIIFYHHFYVCFILTFPHFYQHSDGPLPVFVFTFA